jgi:hypothetical protein
MDDKCPKETISSMEDSSPMFEADEGMKRVHPDMLKED